MSEPEKKAEAAALGDAMDELTNKVKEARKKAKEDPSEENIDALSTLEEQWQDFNDKLQDIPEGGMAKDLAELNKTPA